MIFFFIAFLFAIWVEYLTICIHFEFGYLVTKSRKRLEQNILCISLLKKHPSEGCPKTDFKGTTKVRKDIRKNLKKGLELLTAHAVSYVVSIYYAEADKMTRVTN